MYNILANSYLIFRYTETHGQGDVPAIKIKKVFYSSHFLFGIVILGHVFPRPHCCLGYNQLCYNTAQISTKDRQERAWCIDQRDEPRIGNEREGEKKKCIPTWWIHFFRDERFHECQNRSTSGRAFNTVSQLSEIATLLSAPSQFYFLWTAFEEVFHSRSFLT